jgi:RNA binding exosome subunit
MTIQEAAQSGEYREIRALLEGLSQRVDDTRADAREARDAANKLTERLAAQDVPAQLAHLSGRMEQGFQAARTDLVNSMDKITRETRSELASHHTRITDLEGRHHIRLEKLEAFKNRIEGAGGVFGWLSKNAPWLLSAVLAAAAAVGFKDNV